MICIQSLQCTCGNKNNITRVPTTETESNMEKAPDSLGELKAWLWPMGIHLKAREQWSEK